MGTNGNDRNKSSVASALFGKTRRAVLGLLYSEPDKALYLHEILRATGAGRGAVQRELGRLAAAEIVSKSRRGRQVYYQANPACPVFEELRGLVLKTVGLADVLREVLAPLADGIQVAFIYGSQANGEAKASSDVDLLVVGEPEEMSLHRAVSNAEECLGRPVNYTLFSTDEFHRRRKEKGGFIERVLSGDKIGIVGDPDGL